MMIVRSPLPSFPHEQGEVDVTIDLTRFRRWADTPDDVRAHLEVRCVVEALVSGGVSHRTAVRIAAIAARYAFLSARSRSEAHLAIWHLHAVDRVPAAVLAELEWRHVRLRLGELAVGHPGDVRYFGLGGNGCRLLGILRSRVPAPEPSRRVFTRGDGEPWDGERLSRFLELMDAREVFTSLGR